MRYPHHPRSLAVASLVALAAAHSNPAPAHLARSQGSLRRSLSSLLGRDVSGTAGDVVDAGASDVAGGVAAATGAVGDAASAGASILGGLFGSGGASVGAGAAGSGAAGASGGAGVSGAAGAGAGASATGGGTGSVSAGVGSGAGLSGSGSAKAGTGASATKSAALAGSTSATSSSSSSAGKSGTPANTYKCSGDGSDGYEVDFNGNSLPSGYPTGWLWVRLLSSVSALPHRTPLKLACPRRFANSAFPCFSRATFSVRRQHWLGPTGGLGTHRLDRADCAGRPRGRAQFGHRPLELVVPARPSRARG